MLSLDGSYKPYLLKRLALGASLLPPLCTQRNPREIKQPQPQAASQFLSHSRALPLTFPPQFLPGLAEAS